MGDFDPSAYLAQKRAAKNAPPSSDDFDPTAYLAEKRAANSDTPAPAPTEDTPSPLASAARGFVKGATLDFADEIVGGVKALGSIGSKESFNDAYKRHRDVRRTDDKRYQDANPWWFGGGNVVGSVASSFVPGLGIAKGATLAKSVCCRAKAWKWAAMPVMTPPACRAYS